MEKTSIEKLKLEEAMGRLEETAAKMEEAELPLEQLMALYKDGIALARHCEKLLDQADKEMEILERETQDEE